MNSTVRSPGSGVRGLLGLGLVVLAVSGCGDQRDPAKAGSGTEPTAVAQDPGPVAPDPAPVVGLAWISELLKFHQAAPTITADLFIRVKSPNGDANLFLISLWCPEDGRIRLKCSQLNNDFIEALVQPNGDFVLELVRSKEVARGNLRDVHVFDKNGAVTGPPFLAYLTLLVQEAKSGPVPDRNITVAKDGIIEAKDPTTGLPVRVEVNPDDTVKSKQFFDAPGKASLRLDYFRYKAFNQFQRSTQLNLVIPGDASEYTVSLRKLDAVPAISAERMRFTPSKGSTEIGLEEFLKRLRD